MKQQERRVHCPHCQGHAMLAARTNLKPCRVCLEFELGQERLAFRDAVQELGLTQMRLTRAEEQLREISGGTTPNDSRRILAALGATVGLSNAALEANLIAVVVEKAAADLNGWNPNHCACGKGRCSKCQLGLALGRLMDLEPPEDPKPEVPHYAASPHRRRQGR